MAFKRKGLDDTPNTTRVNLSTTASAFGSDGSSFHKNHKMSRSFCIMAIMKNAFSMSAATAILSMRNLSKMSRICWSNLGPACKQSLRDGPFALEEAS